MTASRNIWKWQIGRVDRKREHMELRYGDINQQNPDNFIAVAIVSPPLNFAFTVQFLLNDHSDDNKAIIEEVRRQLDFYLLQKGEKDPWQYCKYHCSTAANLYSMIHWLYLPNGIASND